MKKGTRVHRKDEPRKLYQAGRLEGAVKNVGITPVKKVAKAKK